MAPQNTFQANHRLRQERVQQNWRQQDLAEQLGTSVLTVKRWERGSHQPGAYFRVKLCALFGRSAEELGFFAPLSHKAAESTPATSLEASPLVSDALSLWCVPYSRNPSFTGREKLLEALHTHLSLNQAMTLTRLHAVHGMGGIGKTQVAVEYAYRHALAYTAVFWIDAEAITASLLAIAELLQLPECQEADQQRLQLAIQRWLRAHDRWLLIWDNLEERAVLQQFLAPIRQGAILITTRKPVLGTLACMLELSPLTPKEGKCFLLRRAKMLHSAAPEEGTGQMPAAEAVAAELVMVMGGLPLALDQASAYIEETGCGLADYLSRYQEQRSRLLDRRGFSGEGHPQSVAATFRLIWQRIVRDHPVAASLLRMCVFLHTEAIPEELFVAANPASLDELLVIDMYEFDLAVAALRTFSLIQRYPETQTLSLHRLVQAVLQKEMSEQEYSQWQLYVVKRLNALFPRSTYAVWGQCERLLPHLLACIATIPTHVCDLELAQVMRKAGVYLYQRARYAQAEHLLQRSRHIQEQALGPEDLQTAISLYCLGLLYRAQGRYQQAEALFQQVLKIDELHLGPTHLDVAWPLIALAYLHCQQEQYEQAEVLLQRALCIREQALGEEHADVASILNNLAGIYSEQRKYEQAEPLYQRALSAWEQALGSEHPDVAYPLSNLAEIYREQGKYEQAEQFSQRALCIWERTLGVEHPQVAFPLHNLAEIYREQGKYEQAESLFERALQVRVQRLGPHHPDTTKTRNSLAAFYRAQAKYEQAESLSQYILHLWKLQLEAEHPEMATSLST